MRNNVNKKAYNAWLGMKARCYYKGNIGYHNYGGRGIIVCDDWKHDYDKFISDMGEPLPNQSIDRIDTDKNYCKDNCRWTDWITQTKNRRDSKREVFNGKEMHIYDIADILGISRKTLYKRLYMDKLPKEIAFTKGRLKRFTCNKYSKGK